MLPRATPERLSTFSDGVFAVLITVLVLELRPPARPTFEALLALWPTWLSYAVSYLFIAIVWANHHYLMRHASEATHGGKIPPHARRIMRVRARLLPSRRWRAEAAISKTNARNRAAARVGRNAGEDAGRPHKPVPAARPKVGKGCST